MSEIVFERMKIKMSRIFQKTLSLVFPQTCPCCGKITGTHFEGVLCHECLSAFSESAVIVCPSCARSVFECRCAPPLSGETAVRPEKRIRGLVFWGFYTGYEKGSAVSALLYRMKRQRDRQACVFFGRLLAERIANELVRSEEFSAMSGRGGDHGRFLITYIPRSDEAERTYGFDHMRIVTGVVADMLGAKMVRVFRRKGGAMQKGLSAADRKLNAESTIFLEKSGEKALFGKKVILIDDIVTTGATMSRAAKLIIDAGAEMIIPAAIMLSRREHSGKTAC